MTDWSFFSLSMTSVPFQFFFLDGSSDDIGTLNDHVRGNHINNGGYLGDSHAIRHNLSTSAG